MELSVDDLMCTCIDQSSVDVITKYEQQDLKVAVPGPYTRTMCTTVCIGSVTYGSSHWSI